ncbi:MAG: thioesterase family protein [Candidatus Tectomicrobia bacterium]|nr:thioesterase family protein [Candidatus Tectomicrobia bacterium]
MLSVDLRVRPIDCDLSGGVAPQTYWRYYAVAENEMFRRGGIKESEITKRFGIVLPRLAVVNHYDAPLALEDEIEVRLWVARLVSRSYTLRGEIWRRRTGRRAARCEIKVCAVSWGGASSSPHAVLGGRARSGANPLPASGRAAPPQRQAPGPERAAAASQELSRSGSASSTQAAPRSMLDLWERPWSGFVRFPEPIYELLARYLQPV